MLRKLLAYEGGRKQNLHASRFGWRNFRVLVITTSAGRAETLRAIIARTPELKSSPLFLFAEHDELSKASILEDFWTDTNGRVHALA